VGLGLSIVKGLVAAHHGQVWAESVDGQGTTLHVVLPRDQNTSRDGRLTDSDPKSILVVDDDDDIRSTLREFLENRGYTVHLAANGREALDRLRQGMRRPGLILLDMMMPVMDGNAFRAEQERDPELSTIPIVVFSAYGNVARTAEALHAAGHLKKPLSPDVLLKTVAWVISQQTQFSTRSG
jgi:CheY-like chemotaxis protein